MGSIADRVARKMVLSGRSKAVDIAGWRESRAMAMEAGFGEDEGTRTATMAAGWATVPAGRRIEDRLPLRARGRPVRHGMPQTGALRDGAEGRSLQSGPISSGLRVMPGNALQVQAGLKARHAQDRHAE